MTARELVAALGGGRWHGSYGTARCPAHEDRSPSLAVRAASGVVLVHCHAGCDQATVIEALRRRGLWPGPAEAETVDQVERARRAERARRDVEEDRRRRTALARQLWAAATPAAGTLAAVYLRSRGLDGSIPATIRFAAALRYPDALGTRLPAMVAAVARWPSRRVVAVHRTYLSADGTRKADVRDPKLTLGPRAGGSVRLAAAGHRLVVSEGIETGLSIQQAAGLPCWAALSADGVEALELPPVPLAGLVLIAADRDASGRGELAAERAAWRWRREGRAVRIIMPAAAGTDWNDVLRGTADAA